MENYYSYNCHHYIFYNFRYNCHIFGLLCLLLYIAIRVD